MSKRLYRFKSISYSHDYKTKDILHTLWLIREGLYALYLKRDGNFIHFDSLKFGNLCTYVWQLSVYQSILFVTIYPLAILGNLLNYKEEIYWIYWTTKKKYLRFPTVVYQKRWGPHWAPEAQGKHFRESKENGNKGNKTNKMCKGE